jgi:hypothetical protein
MAEAHSNCHRVLEHLIRPPATFSPSDAEKESRRGSESPAGFCFQKGTARGLRGRLLLAWLPQARHPAQGQRGVLAGKIRPQQGPRQAGEPRLAAGGLAGDPHLGMRLAARLHQAGFAANSAHPGRLILKLSLFAHLRAWLAAHWDFWVVFEVLPAFRSIILVVRPRSRRLRRGSR